MNATEQRPPSEAASYSSFYGMQSFITMFTRAHHWSLSWVL